MTEPTLAPPSPKGSPKTRKSIIVITAAVAALAALVVGGVAGAAANSHSSEIASLRSQVRTLKGRLAVAQANAQTARQTAATARTTAANAVASAQAQAKAQYASKMAAANALLRRLQHEQQVVQSSTISADGVYVVGKDIPSGTYHTPGNGQPGSLGCYYATLNSTNTSDISDNNNFDGPETVNLSSVYAFQISGGCTWTKIG